MGTNNYTEFEKIIRDKISDYSYQYDQSEWNDFERKMKKSPKNPFISGKNIFYFLAIALIGTLTYFITDHFLSKNSEITKPIFSEKSNSNQSKDVSSKSLGNQDNTENIQSHFIASDKTDNSSLSTQENTNNNFKDNTDKSQTTLNTDNSTKSSKSTLNNNTKPSYAFEELIYSDVVEGCAPLKVQFTPLLISDTISYTWSFGDKKTSTKPAPSHVYSKSGSYEVTLLCKFKKSQQTKMITYSQTIEVKSAPNASFVYGKDEETDVYSFVDESLNAVAWQWNFGDKVISKEKSPKHEYKMNGSYDAQLIIFNTAGCSDTSKKRVDVKLNDIFKIPTAFSPNYDGMNDYFGPKGENLNNDGYKMTIYDKSGNFIFETKDLETQWDGKNSNTNKSVEPGVYIWQIIIKDKYGNIQERTNFVTVIP